jgi:hypothetical protein
MVERGALGGMHTLRRYSLHLYLVRGPHHHHGHRIRVRIVPGLVLSAHHCPQRPAGTVVDPSDHCAALVLGSEAARAWSHTALSSSPCASCMRAYRCGCADGGRWGCAPAQVEALVDGRVPEWATQRQPLSDEAWRVVVALAERSALPRRLRLCAQLSVSRLAHARQVRLSHPHVHMCTCWPVCFAAQPHRPSPLAHCLQHLSRCSLYVRDGPGPCRRALRATCSERVRLICLPSAITSPQPA